MIEMAGVMTLARGCQEHSAGASAGAQGSGRDTEQQWDKEMQMIEIADVMACW